MFQLKETNMPLPGWDLFFPTPFGIHLIYVLPNILKFLRTFLGTHKLNQSQFADIYIISTVSCCQKPSVKISLNNNHLPTGTRKASPCRLWISQTRPGTPWRRRSRLRTRHSFNQRSLKLIWQTAASTSSSPELTRLIYKIYFIFKNCGFQFKNQHCMLNK